MEIYITMFICTAIISVFLIILGLSMEQSAKKICRKKKETRLIKLITSPMFASSIWTMQHTSSKDILEYNNYMTIVQVVPKTTRSTTEMEMIESSRFYLFNVFNELRAALTKPDKDHDSFISKDFAKIWIGKKEVKCYLEKVDRFSVIAMGQDHPVVKEQFKFWKTF